MKQYTVQVSPESYESKPEALEIRKLQRAITQSKLKGPKELLAQHLVNGYAVSTGVLKDGVFINNSKDVEYNEVLMLDFDNDEAEAYTIDDIKSQPWVQENVAFMYETYSTTEERPRFRAVIFLKEAVPAEDVKQTYKYLFEELKDLPMDHAVQNPDRLFFGGNKGEYIEVNMDNEWEAKQLPKPKRKEYSKYKPKTTSSAVPYDEGLDIVTAYVDLRGKDLEDNNYWLDAMYTLHGAMVNGEISEDQAVDYAVTLANGNSKWEDENAERMLKMIEREDVREVVNFRDKFQGYIRKHDKNNDYEDIKNDYAKHLIEPEKSHRVYVEKDENTTASILNKDRDVAQISYADGDIMVYRYEDTGEIESVDWRGTTSMYGEKKPYDVIGDIVSELTTANLAHNGIYIREPNKKYWVNDENVLNRYIARDVGRVLRRANEEIKHQVAMSPYTTEIAENTNRVQLRNDYHLNNGELIKGATNTFTPWYLHVNYEPDAYDEHVDDFLNRISGTTVDEDGNEVVDAEMRLLFEEMIGHILLRNGKDGKMFFLADTKQQGETGKSTLGAMLANFVNGTTYNESGSADDAINPNAPNMASNIQLTEFNDNTIAASMTGKMLNFGDETTMDYLKDTSTIKTLVTQDFIEVRIVYAKNMTRVKSTATFIFATNGMPDIADKSGGIVRRIMIIPFDRKIAETGTKIDLNFGDLLTTDNAKSYILNLGLKGIESMRANDGRVHVPEKVRLANEEYLETNDPVLQFINESVTEKDNPFSSHSTLAETDYRTVYDDFKAWSEVNGITLRKRTTFIAQMALYGYDLERSSKMIETVDGGRGRPKVFVSREDNSEQREEALVSFLKKCSIEDKYWVDVYNDYLDYAEEVGGEELKRSVFDKAVQQRGYEKKKSSNVIAYGSGKTGRPMVYRKPTVTEFLQSQK